MHGVRLRVGVRTSVKGRAELTRTSIGPVQKLELEWPV